MKSFGIAAGVLALALAIPIGASAQPEPSPSPSIQASPAAAPDASTGGFDAGKLTPAQQEALRLAIIKTSQNPVGNITIVPFQNNFNYGLGPYTRFQYILNVQPVVPIMLSTNMTLIARTIFPILNQPSAAPPPVCASPNGCPSTLGNRRHARAALFCAQNQTGSIDLGRGSDLRGADGLAEHAYIG